MRIWKKIILAIIFTFSFFYTLSQPALAAIESLIKCGVDKPTIRICILFMINNLMGVVVGITVVVIIVSGVMYLFSGANIELNEKAKKTLVGAVVGFAIVLGSKFIINEVGCALGWTGATDCGTGAKSMITRMITFLFSIVGIIALIGIIIGGILHIGSAGDESKAKSAKKILVSSVIGLVIALLSATVVRQLEKLFIN